MKISKSTWGALLDVARRASENAYCPYSHFPVGAAVLMEDGAIYSGCNVENVSFGLTICAERNAIFQAVASGACCLQAVATYTPTEKPAPPCGACRQVINEFGTNVELRSYCRSDEVLVLSPSEILPKAFSAADVGRHGGRDS